MENIIALLNSYHIYITIGLCILVIILLIIILVEMKSISNLESKYRKFMRGSDKKSIEEAIHGYMDNIDTVKNENDKMKELYIELNKKVESCVQKVSIIRYRAFEDVGSDLSYSIAILDEKNNGIILTGIYGRNESTTYAKPIDKGISRYDLSEEEKQVLQEAMDKKI